MSEAMIRRFVEDWYYEPMPSSRPMPGVWRQISPRRARKLRKRGERVQWHEGFNSFAWLPR